jgi:hypothetical protein
MDKMSTAQVSEQTPVVPPKKRPPLIFLILLFGLVGVFVYGLKFVFSLGAGDVGSVPFLVFDYTVGLTMIFLPCTLPLAFVIVPMVMGKSYGKGIGMALAFGLGVTITLSFYGVLIGLFGQALGVSQVETAKNILYALAGFFAILFALGELKLIRFSAPVYGGAVPQFIMKRKDISKALLLGLFLGNVGVGCPNPLFNAVIIPQIIVEGSVFQGWLIMFVQALGRITPLFILAFLAILGINATKFLVAHKDAVSRLTAWSTIYVGGFLLTLGLFGHDWWVISGMHSVFEFVTQENFITNLLGSKVAELGHGHGIPTGTGLFGIPIAWGTPFIIIVWIFPMIWYYLYKKKAILTLPPEQQAFEKRFTRLVSWFFVVVSLWLLTVFGFYLPHMFAAHWSQGAQHEEGMEGMEAAHGEHNGAEDQHAGHQLPDASSLLKLPLYTPKDKVDSLPYVLKDGVKEFRLEANEFRWEYQKGKWVHVWGYNNQIPGPEMRVQEGDKVRVIVKNNLPDATTVHWHGVDVPWEADGVPGLTQEAINPGDEYIYAFTAKPAGTHFYHTHGKSHTTTAQQLDMGLSGSLIIEPKAQVLSFDREYTLVLDEWDIGSDGVNSAISHIHGAGEQGAVPDFNSFTINGRVYPDTEKLSIKKGEKVLIRFINAGTAAFHPMHLHGHNFNVVAMDGNILSSPQIRNTITVHPGETVDILVTGDNPGKWLLHCHHVHHASAGMITVLEYD